MENKKNIDWQLVSDGKFPYDVWVLLETSDKAHHVAYYSSVYNDWHSNSLFGGFPKWWAIIPEAPSN